MSVCIHRPEECGSFTSCVVARAWDDKKCTCGAEVQTEVAAEIAAAASGEGE
jgi:hypothetical protein